MIDNREFTRTVNNNFNNSNMNYNNNLNNTGLHNNNYNNNNLNNSNINFYDEAQLAAQLELLKEKLKIKDAEFEYLLNNQKQEYEKTIRERDEEVTGIVDHLLSENQELKRQIIELEIELEQCKEKVSEYRKNYEMNYGQDLSPSADRILNNLNKTENLNLNLSILKKSQQVVNVNNLTGNNLTRNPNTNLSAFLPKSGDNNYFMETVKLMKSNNDLKQNEINDKYNLLIQNLIYDNKVTVENLKRINIENKNRILQDRNALDSLIPIKTLEEQVNSYENKIKTLYEELKSREKYISITENKFEMLNEENNFIKTRLAEERKFLLMKISEIKKEHEETHGKVIKQIQLDIAEKKQSLQAKVEESLKVNEDVIKNLIKEKEKIIEENNFLKKKVDTLNSEIEEIISLKKRSDDNITKIEDEIRTVLHNKKIWSEEQAKFGIEKNKILKANEEMQKQINEYSAKTAALENQIKQYSESEEARARDMDKTLREYDARYKSQIEKLNTQIIDLERKLKQYSFDFEGEENKIFLLEKKIKEDRISYESTLLENESLKVKLNEAKVNLKLLNQSLDEKEKIMEKLRAANSALDIGNVKRDESIRILNERVTVLESEKSSNEDEIQRLMKIKSDLIAENDEVKKSKLYLSTQLDTLKMSNNIEVQRMRSQIYELEKMTEKIHLVQFLENSNNNLKKDLADLKAIILRIHKKYLKQNENEISNTNQNLSPLRKLEELKQLEEIEDILSKALKHDHINHNTFLSHNSKSPTVVKTNPNYAESNKDEHRDFKSYAVELESQINLLKKKLLISENSLKSAVLENQNFLKLQDENKPSLYETILIYIKNINIQHLLEIYNLHLQKEEEFNKVLNMQKSPGASEFANKIKNLSEKLFHLTKHCELAFNDYENRSKAYISIEEFERRLGEYKNFIEQNLNNFLSLLVANMVNSNEFVVFRLNHKEYNQALENISSNLEHYNKLNFDAIEVYKRNYHTLQSALEIIQKQAKVEYDNVKSIIYEENLKFF